MKCKEIKRFIIESSEEELNSHKLEIIEKHLETCDKCASFRDDVINIRSALRKLPVVNPSPELLKQTQSRCQTEIARANIDYKRSSFQIVSSSPIPFYIWAVLAVLLLITMSFVLPQMKDLKLNQSLSFPNILVFSLILQNTAMLFFAPVLIKKFRVKNHDFKHI